MVTENVNNDFLMKQKASKTTNNFKGKQDSESIVSKSSSSYEIPPPPNKKSALETLCSTASDISSSEADGELKGGGVVTPPFHEDAGEGVVI